MQTCSAYAIYYLWIIIILYIHNHSGLLKVSFYISLSLPPPPLGHDPLQATWSINPWKENSMIFNHIVIHLSKAYSVRNACSWYLCYLCHWGAAATSVAVPHPGDAHLGRGITTGRVLLAALKAAGLNNLVVLVARVTDEDSLQRGFNSVLGWPGYSAGGRPLEKCSCGEDMANGVSPEFELPRTNALLQSFCYDKSHLGQFWFDTVSNDNPEKACVLSMHDH